MGTLHNQKRLTPVRRNLRKILSEPERKLWYFLRDNQLQGYKFRRQYSIGRYVVDFYCHKARLAIEIDGDSHYTSATKKYDDERTAYLNSCNIRVIRFTNVEVMKNVDSVVMSIASQLPSP